MFWYVVHMFTTMCYGLELRSMKCFPIIFKIYFLPDRKRNASTMTNEKINILMLLIEIIANVSRGNAKHLNNHSLCRQNAKSWH